MQYFIYALYSPSLDSIYIGQTSDLEKRLHDHKRGYSRYTSRARDWVVVYTEEVADRSTALKREKQLKSYRGRAFIYSLLSEKNQ